MTHTSDPWEGTVQTEGALRYPSFLLCMLWHYMFTQEEPEPRALATQLYESNKEIWKDAIIDFVKSTGILKIIPDTRVCK
jgi:hypothetical protein